MSLNKVAFGALRILFRFSRILILLGGFCLNTMAKTQENWVTATVLKKAPVFKSPSFDSPILGYLKKGRKVQALAGQLFDPGFIKIRLKNIEGYMLDTDVNFPGKPIPPPGPLKNQSQDPEVLTPIDEMAPEPPTLANDNVRFSVLSSFINYRDKLTGKFSASPAEALGLTLSGYKLFENLGYVTLSLLTTTRPPLYFRSGPKVSGFMGWLNFSLGSYLPLSQRWELTYGFGPFLKWHYWDILQPQKLEIRQLIMGAQVHVGINWWLNPHWGIQGGWHYYYEQTQYHGFWLGLSRAWD